MYCDNLLIFRICFKYIKIALVILVCGSYYIYCHFIVSVVKWSVDGTYWMENIHRFTKSKNNHIVPKAVLRRTHRSLDIKRLFARYLLYIGTILDDKLSSVFNFVCVCLSVCLCARKQATEHTFYLGT